MLIHAMVSECDLKGIKYDAPVQGAWVISQGATGRWCPVLYVGPEFLAGRKEQPITREEALARVEQEGGWAEF